MIEKSDISVVPYPIDIIVNEYHFFKGSMF